MFEGILQPTHLIIILVIVLIVFGPGKLPEIGGSLGRGINEFKRSISPDADAGEKAAQPPAKTAPAVSVCPTCQTENQAGNQFCGKCGTRLS